MRYPPNAKVTAHYRPSKPDVAALETKFDSAVFWKKIGLMSVVTLMFAYGTFFGATLGTP